ncbi:hypothetical protein J6TS1_37300 [Siminovitchia terrae]|uniref:Uncharacterized protein n=1 Tax=Siminovitchia terrae TaxID=1914933 RepID=A0ABQ4L1X7_SIMTE|nr:HTH domain-containing protein [Siminovitchia terrae]GIN97860.1 hypothetical protein J6TS1_37300 [Siminovitchia terrae]
MTSQKEIKHIEISGESINVYKKEIQSLTSKFDLNLKQLSKLLNKPLTKINNIIHQEKIDLTDHEKENIQHKSAMLHYGLSGIEAKERAQIILDTLAQEFDLSLMNISKLLDVSEKELLNFKENIPIERNLELNICVNIIMLNFTLHQNFL